MFEKETKFIRSCFPGKKYIPLHEPSMGKREIELVSQVIDSGYVSSIGAFVNQFESMVCEYTGAGYAIATVNGTAALHIALLTAGVKSGEEVLTQPLTFVATANAIRYCQADPVFIDVDQKTMGLSFDALEDFFKNNVSRKNESAFNKKSGKRIAACLPVHVFGHVCQIDKITEICSRYGVPVIEDSAEALGSRYKDLHSGRFGKVGIFSFNGNKIVTAGGGGVIITDDEDMAIAAKHLTTTARCKDSYEFYHDAVGFNYRMPNLNAAFACAQMEKLEAFIANKRSLAWKYKEFFSRTNMKFVKEPEQARSNFWLNSLILESREIRDKFLRVLMENQIMVRPVWKLMNELPMYENCHTHSSETAKLLADRVVSLPSSVRL